MHSEIEDGPAQPQDWLTLSLPSELDLRQASALQETLLAGLNRGVALCLDAAGVTRMSTASVQVLIAFVVAAGQRGIPVTIRTPSPVFQAAFALLGLSAVFASATAR